MHINYYHSASIWMQSVVSVRLSVCLVQGLNGHISGRNQSELHIKTATNLLPVTAAWSSNGGVSIRYVILVLWMT